MKKRVLSIVLTLTMLLSLVPVMENTASATLEGTPLSGDIGSYTISSNGIYYLNGDTTGNITVSVGTTVTLNLNGHVLKGAGNGSVIKNNGTLYITDSDTSVTHYFTDNKCAHSIAIGEECTVADTACAVNNNKAVKDGSFETLYTGEGIPTGTEGTDYVKTVGGCITGGTGTYAGSFYHGGGIYNTGTLTINGGNVVGNKTQKYGGGIYNTGTLTINGSNIVGNGTIDFGGGVYNGNSGAFTAKNATISYNAAQSGGGVYNDTNSSFIAINTTIARNTGKGIVGGVYAAGAVTVGGSTKIIDNIREIGDGTVADNLRLNSAAKITIGKGENINSCPVPGNDMEIGVHIYTMKGGQITGAFTTNGSEDDIKYFTSDNPKYTVAYNAGTGSGGYLELVVSDAYKWYCNNTSATSFEISNIDELEALAYIVNSGTSFTGKTIELADDFKNVKMDGTTAAKLTTPIGTDKKPFEGTFDGNGKEVELNITGKQYAGIFGSVEGGTIQNVGTSGTVSAYEANESYAGGIVGYMTNSVLVNCSSTCTVSASTVNESATTQAGGLVGHAVAGFGGTCMISNSYARGTATASGIGILSAGGIVGGTAVFKGISCTVSNCYATGMVSATGGSANYIGGIVGECDGTVTNCYCLDLYDSNVGIEVPASQMQGIAMQTAESGWVSLGSYGTVSMVDALNKGCTTDYYWGVMKDGTTPVFTLPLTITLRGGKAYFEGNAEDDIPLPDGISYQSGKYILKDVCLARNKHTVLIFADNNVIVELKGDNQIGSLADTTKFIIKDDSAYTGWGIQAQGNITFTGNGNLTVYDETEGITATEDITFNENFTGTVTINDYGAQPQLACCLSSSGGDITIKNGTFYLNNTSTYGMNSKNPSNPEDIDDKISITGGTICVKGGQAAIGANTLTIADNMEITGANETYTAGTTKSLTNKTGTEYVVIKAKQVSTDGGSTFAVTIADTANGSVTASKRYAYGGAAVILTVKPADGYKLDTLTVVDAKGNTIAVKDGKFTMPGSNVTVSATFVKNTCPQDETCVYAKFSDANPMAWYHDGVHFCVEYGYMNGVSASQFAPNGTLSRAMIVTMLWRIEGEPVVNYAMSFKDVAPDFWYTEAIRWAQSTGVVLGYDETTFGPEDNVTREQLATILWRYAKYKGYDVSVGEDTNILSYDDAIGGMSEYAIPALQWACGAGIINGIGTRLEARDSATRAQAACMVQRFCVNVAK